VKKGSSGKSLDIILFAYSRGVPKSCSELKDMWVMVVCLRRVKNITCDQFFFTDFVFAHAWWRRIIQGKNYPVIDALAHGEHNGANYNPVWHSICKLCPLCPIACVQIDFLLLLLCRAIIHKAIGISGLSEHTFGLVDNKHLIN